MEIADTWSNTYPDIWHTPVRRWQPVVLLITHVQSWRHITSNNLHSWMLLPSCSTLSSTVGPHPDSGQQISWSFSQVMERMILLTGSRLERIWAWSSGGRVVMCHLVWLADQLLECLKRQLISWSTQHFGSWKQILSGESSPRTRRTTCRSCDDRLLRSPWVHLFRTYNRSIANYAWVCHPLFVIFLGIVVVASRNPAKRL